jgi:mannose-6-phosphate isomerase-like protein (cupin superfamily)
MRTGTVIENPVTGQRMELLASPEDTGGRSFRASWEIPAHSGREGVPEHFHPTASERFTITAGQARYRLGGIEADLSPGQSVDMPAGVPHIHPWSTSDEPLHYTQEATVGVPDVALLDRSLDGLATMFALAREGKVNRLGVPGPLQMAVLGNYIKPGTYLAVMPVLLQRVVLPALAAVGYVCGLRPHYPRHRTA